MGWEGWEEGTQGRQPSTRARQYCTHRAHANIARTARKLAGTPAPKLARTPAPAPRLLSVVATSPSSARPPPAAARNRVAGGRRRSPTR